MKPVISLRFFCARYRIARLRVSLLWVFCGACVALPAVALDPITEIAGMDQASLLLQERGRDLFAQRPETPRVPASTMKLLTAFAALETWGRDRRFSTEVYRDDAGWLWVKGSADPYLVSEELERLVAALVSKGLREVAGIGLDDRFFDPNVEIAGRSASDNPYDAPVTALAANFNTLDLVRDGAEVRSAEPQTPLTETAHRLGLAGAAGRQRVNLRDRETALRYFGELLAAKLKHAGVRVGDQFTDAPVPHHATLFYRHLNRRTLVEIVEPMLKFSNNFIANALFLRLAQPTGTGRVSMAAARRTMTEFAQQRFGWREFRIDDGAGLARTNQLSARQLVELLGAFTPYRELLPQQDNDPNVRAKTGTLRGVSCYAGYVRRAGDWSPFALLINQPVESRLRQRIASSLVR